MESILILQIYKIFEYRKNKRAFCIGIVSKNEANGVILPH